MDEGKTDVNQRVNAGYFDFYRLTKAFPLDKIGKRLGAQGSIAQLGEHLPYKQRVTGSSPVVPTSTVAR